MDRFIAKKREALDGKIWWCIYDTKYGRFSPYTCHGMYTRKKDATFSIKHSENFLCNR